MNGLKPIPIQLITERAKAHSYSIITKKKSNTVIKGWAKAHSY